MPPQSNSPGRMEKHSKREYSNDHRVRSNDRSTDQQSTDSGSAATSGAPNSVYLACTPLTRELSDLSGSYLNGTANRSTKDSVPGHIYDHASFKGPWRQAYALSQVPPNQKENRASKTNSADATILVSQNDVVEIVDSLTTNASAAVSQPGGNIRIPVHVLLMDATTHSYELMQVWIDRSSDSVRDLVQCLRQSIPDKWKQDYDGIFQVRGNRFTQLIHILRLLKYDVQPHEIVIAKPRSMTAKVTISCATSAIRHLTTIGIIDTDSNDKSGRRVFRPKSEESPLLLSKEALSRVYAPNGSFDHHHAVQFLTFSPPFDPNVTPVEIPSDRDGANSSLGSHSGTSGVDAPLAKGSVLSALACPGCPGRAHSPRSITQTPHENCSDTKSNQIAPFDGSNVGNGASNNNSASNNFSSDITSRRRTFSGMVSKLNCCKSKEKLQAAQVDSRPVTTLTEEQERQWSGFDTRLITDDHQSITGQSIISMSAPLLSTNQETVNVHRSKSKSSDYFNAF